MDAYEYIDGNGNSYFITSTSITYDPITPKESSTGTYSGGEPYVASIEPQQYQDLETVLITAIQTYEGHTKDREKGTGMLIVYPWKTTYIFTMDSQQKKDIEAAILLLTRR